MVDRWNSEVWGHKSLDAVDELIDVDYEHTMIGIKGPGAARRRIQEELSSGRDYSDLRIIETIAERDCVVQIRKDGVAVYRLKDGKILADSWYTESKL